MANSRIVEPEAPGSRWRREDLAPSTLDGVIEYRCRGVGDAALYVGVSRNTVERLRQHTRDDWWCQVKSIELIDHPDYRTALEAERATIKELAPPFNIRSAVRHGR